jgi:hypothetical protein
MGEQDTSALVFIGLLMGVVWAFTCVGIARRKGRSTSLAALLGFFFGLFAVIGYLIVRAKVAPVPWAMPAAGAPPMPSAIPPPPPAPPSTTATPLSPPPMPPPAPA